MKISVYAIAKNESKFADRWADSMSEADEIVVLDTGSSDDTVEKLTKHGVKVTSKSICPWRFDVARNESMKLVSADSDVLVCTDLDEVFVSGWRAKLEHAWSEAMHNGQSPTTAKYEYVWNFNSDGSDGLKFTYSKIHAPNVCNWSHAVHEILEYHGRYSPIDVPGMRLEHHPDEYKSRFQYLQLLEDAVKDDPQNSRDVWYLGREYMLRRNWKDAITTFKQYLQLKTSSWNLERAAAMLYMSRCIGKMLKCMNKTDDSFEALKNEQELWLWRAIAEAPSQRESLLELAELLYQRKDWNVLVYICEKCLSISTRSMTHFTEASAWGFRLYDLYSLGLWYTGKHEKAIQINEHAMRLAPNNIRLKDNDAIMRKLLLKQKN